MKIRNIFMFALFALACATSSSNACKTVEIDIDNTKAICGLGQVVGVVSSVSKDGFWINVSVLENEGITKMFIRCGAFIHGIDDLKIGETIAVLHYQTKEEGVLLVEECREFIDLFNWVEGGDPRPWRTLKSHERPVVFGAFIRYVDREKEGVLKALTPMLQK